MFMRLILCSYAYDVHVQMYTRELAKRFSNVSPKRIEVQEAYLLELPNRGPKGVWAAMERHMEGDYVKFNSNIGFVNANDALSGFHRAQAFSHWTWEDSKGAVLACDIQGIGRYITDPAVHTKDPRKLKAMCNRGSVGMTKFFESHRCNHICHALGLRDLSARTEGPPRRLWGNVVCLIKKHVDQGRHVPRAIKALRRRAAAGAGSCGGRRRRRGWWRCRSHQHRPYGAARPARHQPHP
jgi:hypothetical protein